MSNRMRVLISMGLALLLALGLTSFAFADSTGNTGQPNQTCGSADALLTPGFAANALGSAFNPDGIAGMVYAGQQPQNSGNPTAVSQYDVACFQVSQPH